MTIMKLRTICFEAPNSLRVSCVTQAVTVYTEKIPDTTRGPGIIKVYSIDVTSV